MKTIKAAVLAAIIAAGVASASSAEAAERGVPCPAGTYTVSYGSFPICEMGDGQRLDVIFARAFAPPRFREAWGGDASLRWATRECLRYGGQPRWHRGVWMRCADVDQ